jgi:hypothetical protein
MDNNKDKDGLITKLFTLAELKDARKFLVKMVHQNMDEDNDEGSDLIDNVVIKNMTPTQIVYCANQYILVDTVDKLSNIYLGIPHIYGEDVKIVQIDLTQIPHPKFLYECVRKGVYTGQAYFYISGCKNTAFAREVCMLILDKYFVGSIMKGTNDLFVRLYPVERLEPLLKLAELINKYY